MLVLCRILKCANNKNRYRARAVVLLSMMWVFGDTSKVIMSTVPALFFIKNKKLNYLIPIADEGECIRIGMEYIRMENIDVLYEAAQFLGMKNIEEELNAIKAKSGEDAELVLPLVGEFSSGKTTLINALTDSKKLETATKPTTATIYEVHFGCDRCHATVLTAQREHYEVEDIALLKNDTLGEALLVNIFDTSNRIPSSITLVDTPGLSSPNPQHKQTLTEFLPHADAILLVTDVNQQLTRSLTDFIKTMKLAKRPIFLIITKSDTKSKEELEQVKKYISENSELPVQQMACVSAQSGDLEELSNLLNKLQKEKTSILQAVNKQRIQTIGNTLIQQIDEMLKASSSDKDLEEAIRRQEYDLSKLERNIDKLVDSANHDIEDQSRNISRRFEDMVSERLDSLVAGKSSSFDNEAVSMINGTASLLLNQFKESIYAILQEKAKSAKGTVDGVSLQSLERLDMSGLAINGISYNLNLDILGHEYDSMISSGVKVVAAVAAAAAVVSTAGAALAAGGTATAAGGAAAAAGSAAAVAEGAAAVRNVAIVADVADTLTDVGSVIANRKMASRIEKTMQIANQTPKNLKSIEGVNQQLGQQSGASKGMVESMVGLITDKMIGKPQRKRAIRNYMEGTLLPQFKGEMKRLEQQLSGSIRSVLHEEAKETVGQMTASLEKLKADKQEKKALFEKRVSKLRDYKNQIVTL